jgi:peptidoglycan hydrolase-like protein with peptidoglycan-binding domain
MIRLQRPVARDREVMQTKMSKLPITASLVLASFVYACSASAANLASSVITQQSSAAPAPTTSSAATTTTALKKRKSSKTHHSSKREPTQKAPTPQRISEIQSALAHGGYYQGTPNGKWDSNTVAAMQKFQSDNGLSSSGKIDALSLEKLGLGSGTAGVDAPKPVKPANSTTNTSSAASPPATATTTASSATPTANSPAPAPHR